MMKTSIIKRFGNGKINFVLVCCLHGDDLFGRKVFRYFEKNASHFGSFKLILAHPEALKQKKRYLTNDLNRSFPGRRNGNIEEKIAMRLMRHIPETAYVIDIHETPAEVGIAPAIATLNKYTQKMLNLCPSKNIIHLHKAMKRDALIGQFERGMSLLVSRRYAKSPEAIAEIEKTVLSLVQKKRLKKRERKIYYIENFIDENIRLPKKVRNFERVRGLGIYPVLYHRNSIGEAPGLMSREFTSMII